VPLETLRTVVDLAIEIGVGGKAAGRHSVCRWQSSQVSSCRTNRYTTRSGAIRPRADDQGSARSPRASRNRPARRSVIISGRWHCPIAGRHLDAPAGGSRSRRAGVRHWAAAAMSKPPKPSHRRLGINRHRPHLPGWAVVLRVSDASGDEVAELEGETMITED